MKLGKRIATCGRISMIDSRHSLFLNSSNYILRCKLEDIANGNNDNLWRYVKTYTELVLNYINHMHELDWVCNFVMGLPT